MVGYIYKITNLINNKIYIGRRKKSYFDKNYWGSGKILNFAIKKYGKENFKREILCWCETMEELNEKEKFFIKLYDSQNKYIGYNISIGGNGGRGPLSEKEKLHLSQINTGCKNPNWGLHRSQETKDKISKANKGRRPSLNTILAAIKAKKNIPVWNKGKSIPKLFKKVIVNDSIIYDSVKDCAKQLGVHRSCVSYAIINKGKTHGYKIRYYEVL